MINPTLSHRAITKDYGIKPNDTYSRVIILAQAGFHGDHSEWIPVCAGMTSSGFESVSLLSKRHSDKPHKLGFISPSAYVKLYEPDIGCIKGTTCTYGNRLDIAVRTESCLIT